MLSSIVTGPNGFDTERESEANGESHARARTGQAFCRIYGLAEHDSTLYEPKVSPVRPIRWARDQRPCRLDWTAGISAVSRSYRAPTVGDSFRGSRKKRHRVSAWKRSLGDARAAEPEHIQERLLGCRRAQADSGRVVRRDRYRGQDTARTNGSRPIGRKRDRAASVQADVHGDIIVRAEAATNWILRTHQGSAQRQGSVGRPASEDDSASGSAAAQPDSTRRAA